MNIVEPRRYEYECWTCNEWHSLGDDITTEEEASKVASWTGADVRPIKDKEF